METTTSQGLTLNPPTAIATKAVIAMDSTVTANIEPPMTAGRLLADLHPFSIDIDATTGDAWTCTGTCGVHPVRAREARGAVPRLELYSPSDSAWDAALLLPRFSASRPAIQ